MLLNFVKLSGFQLTGVEIGWVGIFLGRNFPGGNCLGNFRVEIGQVGIILDGNFLGGNCPSGCYPWWKFFGYELSWVEIFFDESFPGDSCPVGIIRVGIFRLGVFMLTISYQQ